MLRLLQSAKPSSSVKTPFPNQPTAFFLAESMEHYCIAGLYFQEDGFILQASLTSSTNDGTF